MPPHYNRVPAAERARVAWAGLPPSEIQALARACDEKGQNRIANEIGIARSTVSELINNKRDLAGHRTKLINGLAAIGFPADAESVGPPTNIAVEVTRPTPDLGEIDWRDEPDQPLRRGRVVFAAPMCALHWAIVAEGEDGRVPLIIRKDIAGASMSAVVMRADPITGRFLASQTLLGRPPHKGLGAQINLLAEAALFYATGAGAYL